MKRIVLMIIVSLMLLTSFNVYAADDISGWAKEHFKLLEKYGVEIREGDNGSYKEDITRIHFSIILHDTYEEYKSESVNVRGVKPFYDTTSPDAAAMYVLGIASGDGDGNFNPKAKITRQEAAKMLCNFYYVLKEEKLPENVQNAKAYADYKEIASWAQDYVSVLGATNIMNGRGEGRFCPKDNLTIEEAVTLISRVVQSDGKIENEAVIEKKEEVSEKNDEKPVDKIIGAPILEEGKTETITWAELPDCDEYTVTVTEYRNTIHGEELGSNVPVSYTVNEKEFTFNTKPVRRYVIVVTSGSESKEFEVKTSHLRPWSENLQEIETYGLPTTKEEADALMEEVTVDIWKLSNGEKVASKATFVVHKAIAEKVRCIFKEIFEGEEQFPINSIGGYSWRGGKSEHNYGTALDINPNENYCIYTNGTIVGNYYKPGEDPYSFPPFGEVIEIFEKYGFNWGGDTWRGNRDFMHFSYCGT